MAQVQVCESKCQNEYNQRWSELESGTDFYHGTLEINLVQKDLDACLSQCYTCAKGTVMRYFVGTRYDEWCQCPKGSSVPIINLGEPFSACRTEVGAEDRVTCLLSYPLDDEECDECQKLSASFDKAWSNLDKNKLAFDPKILSSPSRGSIENCKKLKRATEDADTTLAPFQEKYTGVSAKCENFKKLSAFEAASKINTKITEELGRVSGLNKSANDCIAAFKQGPSPSLDPYPNSNPNWSDLVEITDQAFKKLSDSGEDSIDGEELGSSPNAPNPASSPSFKQFNNNNGGLRESPYSRFNDEDPGGFNGDGDFKDSIQNPQRTHGNKNSRNQASQTGHDGPSGANGGGFGSRNNGGGISPSTNANQRGQARRRFASTKKRNLVLGYKRVKKGGSALTYHPADLKKYGRDHVLTMARKAKKTFGEETPLLFENGEFIRDYLEMKNSLAWKKHNLRQRNRFSGIFKTKEEREKKAFHPCALAGECYTESRYNIFMLHHFAAIKYLKPED